MSPIAQSPRISQDPPHGPSQRSSIRMLQQGSRCSEREWSPRARAFRDPAGPHLAVCADDAGPAGNCASSMNPSSMLAASTVQTRRKPMAWSPGACSGRTMSVRIRRCRRSTCVAIRKSSRSGPAHPLRTRWTRWNCPWGEWMAGDRGTNDLKQVDGLDRAASEEAG